MAAERTYYTIDPEGKLTCMKCKVPLVKGKAKFMYLENGFPIDTHGKEEQTPDIRRGV